MQKPIRTETLWSKAELAALSTLIDLGHPPRAVVQALRERGCTRSDESIKRQYYRVRSGSHYVTVGAAALASVRLPTLYDPIVEQHGEPMLAPRGDDGEHVVGVVGDLHLPFTLPGYLDFCADTFTRWGVTRVVLIGDVVDHHASSYHESDPDGLSAGDEMARARELLRDWYAAFPVAVWILGNHDKVPLRRAFSAGLSARCLRSNIYDMPPRWATAESATIDGVLYTHGTGASGINGHRNLAQRRGVSCVIGHYHRAMGIEYMPTHDRELRFGVATGCGFDGDSYAAAYGRDFGRMALGCAVVRHGREAHSIPMLASAQKNKGG